MYKGKSIAVIVPARGGSKGLPGKNIKPLCGKPLIVYTLDCSRNSGIADLIVLSTDSVEIAKIAGAPDVWILKRPIELATDDTKGVDVFIHAVDSIKKNMAPSTTIFTFNRPLHSALQQILLEL